VTSSVEFAGIGSRTPASSMYLLVFLSLSPTEVSVFDSLQSTKLISVDILS